MKSKKERFSKSLCLDENDSVLEIMSNEDQFTSLLIERVREVETIEADPKLACSVSWKAFYSKRRNHFVFCGHPCVFLQKKIEDKAKIDAIIVNADRLAMPEKIWSQVKLLNPNEVILTYHERKNGEYHKKLMEENGFKVMKGDWKDGISEKFCVGRSSKRNSK